MEALKDRNYYLKWTSWFIRLVLAIAILIPGSIPALLLFITRYVLRIFDPNDLLINSVGIAFDSFMLMIPAPLHIWIRPLIILKVVLIYFLVIKLMHPREKLGNVLRRKFKTTYDRYVKAPVM
ncbi:MAG: hypothetical protein INQ03_09720 [Candidatus Heimdallarchaeota archaeon]|nr:hypothetical protein [Candidatus Heimdallarchaeota archaeon]